MRLLVFATFLISLICAAPGHAGSVHLFAKEYVMDLTLVATDREHEAFEFMNRNQQIRRGNIGDLVGIEVAKVVAVDDLTVSLEFRDGAQAGKGQINIVRIPRVQTISTGTGGKGVQ